MTSPQDAQVELTGVVASAHAGSLSIEAVVKAEVEALAPETDESQALFALEIERLKVKKLELDNDLLTEGLADRKADRELRKRYADAAFRFLIFFSIFCGVVLICQGIPQIPFKLAENIVVALIGSTAAAVIGLVGWVARGLFKAPGS